MKGKHPRFCPVHPRYQAKRKPTSNCGYCLHVWKVIQDGKRSIARLMELMQ